jgi:glycine dehydrogenase subunit 2
MRFLTEKAKAGDKERFTEAPMLTPWRRLDETGAARKPVLRWTPPEPDLQAAE